MASDIVIPSIDFLKASDTIQARVDDRIKELVSGFCSIIKEKSNVQTKNNMLSYVADLMEDCHDFGWQSAKGAHAVVLCHMEENKVNWEETNKLDRLR